MHHSACTLFDSKRDGKFIKFVIFTLYMYDLQVHSEKILYLKSKESIGFLNLLKLIYVLKTLMSRAAAEDTTKNKRPAKILISLRICAG